MKHTTLLVVFMYLCLINSFAQLDTNYFEKIKSQKVNSNAELEWTQFGPGMSGYNEMFWCHPTDANTMFMGPDMHVSYGTWDNGESWQSIKDYDGNGLDMRRVHDIEFSLQDADYGVAIEREGEILETLDRGRTWRVISDLGKAYAEVAIHPTNDNIWFIGAGDFWNVKANHKSLAKPNGIVQSRAEYGYVLKTLDKGRNWTRVATNISSDLDVGRIIFNPINADKMLMATSHGVFRSTDGGENWIASNTGLPNNLPRDLTSFYNEANGAFELFLVEQTVYKANGSGITTKGGVYKSVDTGKNWTNITGNLGINLETITDYWPRDRYHRAVAYWLGISKSVSKATYTTYPTNTMPVFNRIVVNPINKKEIYLCHNKKSDFSFGPGDLWKTEDGGLNWFPCARNGSYWLSDTNKSYWEQKKSDAVGTNITFGHLQSYMDHSNEGSGTRHLAINKKGHVFIGIDQQTLRSTDKGKSWQQIDDNESASGSKKWIGRGTSNLPGRFMLHETGKKNRRLLCSGEHGLWQTTGVSDFSASDVIVEQIEGQVHEGGSHTASTVAVHPTNSDIIYILIGRQDHRGKLRRSMDGGKTWENIATIFEASNNSWENVAPQYSLIIDPDNPNNMYFTSIRKAVQEVGTSIDESILTKGGFGIYRSTDGGFNWTYTNKGLPSNASVRRIAMHPDNPKTLYAALNQFGNNDPGGLYKSTDKTANWSKVTIPSEIKSVNNVFIDRNTKHIFISCGARSGEYEAGGVWRSKNDGTSWEKIFAAPYVWQTEVSPVNSNVIIVSVPAQIPKMVNDFMNPGIYLSDNAGQNWTKINKGLGQPAKIVDVKPDPYEEDVLWCAGWGCGWYKAVFSSSSNESVSFNNVPSAIKSSSIFSLDVSYTASSDRELVVILSSPSGVWLGNGKQTVIAGSGSTTVNFTLTTAPAAAENYQLRCDIRPVSGDGNTAIDTKEQNIDLHDAFYIVNRQTDKKIRCANTTDGNPISQVPSSWVGDPTQWIKIDAGNDYFYLKNVDADYYFRPSDEADGSILIQRPSSYSGDYTQWKQVSTSGGYFYLENKSTAMYFRPETDADHSNILQRPTSYSGYWTQWKFENVTAATTKSLQGSTEADHMNSVSQGISIYPNPVNGDELNISLSSDADESRVMLYDVRGVLVYNNLIKQDQLKLSVNDFEKGIYLVRIISNNNIFTQKVIVN